MGQKVKLPKSNVIGKTPNDSTMEFGELYVNYASGTGNSFLVTKKNDGSLAKFPETPIHVYREANGIAASSTRGGNSGGFAAVWSVTDNSVADYVDGMVVCIKVPVEGDSKSGTTIQINNLEAKPVVYNVNSAIGTRYGVGSIVWCVYNSTQTAAFYSGGSKTSTGCWQVMDYDSDTKTNSIGYQLRTSASTRSVTDATYRYRILFSSADNTQWVPSNSASSTNATSSRNVTTRPINPFGRIVYYGATTIVTANSNVHASYQWDQYALTLGYSFNKTGAALSLTYPAPVYIKCTPQADGSAIIDPNTPYVQELPDTKDSKIYIYLGQTFNTTQVEMTEDHPVYYHDGNGIMIWTGKEIPDSLSDLTNDTGFITTADTKYFITSAVTNLKFFASSSATVTALNGKQDTISDLAKIRSDAASGYSAYQTLTGHVASASHITSTERTNWNKKIDSGVTAMQNFATSANVVTALSGKANTGDIKDSTITIQKNGSTVKSFTLNQSSNDTINITVPTSLTGLTNDAGFITSAVTSLKNYATSANVVSALDTKVDKETGKGLSTNDYTTNEKNKLAGIETNAQKNGNAYKLIKVNATGANLSATTSADTFTISAGTNITLTAGEKKVTISAKDTLPGTLTTTATTSLTTATNESLSGSVSLHKVSKTGSYSDLLNKPTIPTVNNNTITIQKNGTTVDSFTLNQSSDKSINIPIPTNVNELTNGSGFITSGVTAMTNYATSANVVTALSKKPDVTFTTIAIGTTNIVADSSADTLTITAGNNITLTPNSTNDSITIAATNTTYTAATATPMTVTSATGVVGTSDRYAREDHKHQLTLATGDANGQVKIGGTNVSVKGLASAAYTSSSDYVPTGRTVNGKNLGSNITLSASDVSALTNTTKYAASIALTQNETNFQYTWQLKDQDGNNLGAAQTLDLPIDFFDCVMTEENGVWSCDKNWLEIYNAHINGKQIRLKHDADIYMPIIVEATIALFGYTATLNEFDTPLVISRDFIFDLNGDVFPVGWSHQDYVSFPFLSSDKEKLDYIDANYITSGGVPTQIWTGPIVGKMYRNDVSGTGNLTIKGNYGMIPTISATGQYIISVYSMSDTQSYAYTLNFSNVSYTVSTTNGQISDRRVINITSTGNFSGSVSNGSVAAGTILIITMQKYETPVKGVGIAAVTNNYNDLDGKPSIPTVNNKTITITTNSSATAGTFTLNQSSDKSINITVPTKVSDLNNDSNFIASGDVVNALTTKTDAAFKTIKVAGTDIIADSKDDTLTITAGANIGLVPNATNDSFIISATNTTYTNQSLGQGYATSTATNADTAKTATLSGYELIAGGIVSVKFSGHVAANATLNINSKGAYPILYNGSSIKYGLIRKGNTATFIFDGSNYHLLSIDDSYQAAYCISKGSVSNKEAVLTGYSANSGTYITVIMCESNTYGGTITLNINNQGAKQVYINDYISSPFGYLIPAGAYIVYYDGTNYYFRTDGKIPMSNGKGFGGSYNDLTDKPSIPDVAFKTINANATAVTASSSADTVTLTGSTYISLAATGTGATKKIQISATGLQPSISDLATIRSNASSGYSAYTGLTAHTVSASHITSTDRTNWNNKIDSGVTAMTYYATSADVVTALNNKADDSEVVKFYGPGYGTTNEYYCSHFVDDIKSKVESNEQFSISFRDTSGRVWQPDRIVCNNDNGGTVVIYLKTPELSNVKLPDYSVYDYYISANTTFNVVSPDVGNLPIKSSWYGPNLSAGEISTLKINDLLSGSPANGSFITYTANNNSSAWTPVGRNSITMNVNGTNYNFIGISTGEGNGLTYIPINTEYYCDGYFTNVSGTITLELGKYYNGYSEMRLINMTGTTNFNFSISDHNEHILLIKNTTNADEEFSINSVVFYDMVNNSSFTPSYISKPKDPLTIPSSGCAEVSIIYAGNIAAFSWRDDITIS